MKRKSVFIAAVVCVAGLSTFLATRGQTAPELISEKMKYVDEADAALDFCRLKLTFRDEFNDLSIQPYEIGNSRWIAHTPWNGDFGDAGFMNPDTPESPFSVKDGVLSITMSKGADGKWKSGLLSSRDGTTKGFAQQYGYFEINTKLPRGPGVWPAFWLNSNTRADSPGPDVEIDSFEYYGVDSSIFHTTLHIWHKSPRHDDDTAKTLKVPAGSLSDEFHTFGVKVSPKTITFYLDRRPYWQIKTPREHVHPLGILVALAAGSGWPIDKMIDPSVMEVDYIRAYEITSSRTSLFCNE